MKNNIAEINNKIINILTIIEHELDFSENEINYTTNQSVLTILSEIQSTVQSYLNNQKLVQVINKGINIVIMGIPNAGKSSLFNQIVGYNRTIVSDEQGTTRDSIEMKLVINQYPINLIASLLFLWIVLSCLSQSKHFPKHLNVGKEHSLEKPSLFAFVQGREDNDYLRLFAHFFLLIHVWAFQNLLSILEGWFFRNPKDQASLLILQVLEKN